MSTKDIEISRLSYTSKDFGTMYPEVLDLAKQLTTKWDPSQSNESDPGVVLLKEAAFVADHNNYNIDKNILENFLPSATQDKSVRNICEINGYTPRYYVSATGDVTIKYENPDDTNGLSAISIPAYTFVISDADQTVTYTQIESLTLSNVNGDTTSLSGSCKFMEGTLQSLTVNGSSIITAEFLDDNNRLYFPEGLVAQNGVFISYASSDDTGEWVRNNFLAAQPALSRVYKIDYDSDNGTPYIEFPSDISSIIGSGLIVKYMMTSGEIGNVSANTLVAIQSPSTISDTESTYSYSIEYFSANNASSMVNGKDPETITEMYNSFKNVVGTFETLVTTRDYTTALKMLEEDDAYIISNGFVTDRRNDYNNAVNIVVYDTAGVYTKSISTKPARLRFIGESDYLSDSVAIGDLTVYDGSLMVYNYTGWENASTINLNDFSVLTQAMTPYDLSIYALKAYSVADYMSDVPYYALEKSFTPADKTTLKTLEAGLTDQKCICHDFKDIFGNEIYAFKNYTPLNISIVPYNKVSKTTRDSILNNVYKAISDNFNPRVIDFGEALDTETLKSVILAADTNIKDVNIGYSTIAKAMLKNGKEYKLTDTWDKCNCTFMVDLIAKNVLAGRVCLFTFDSDFGLDYGQIDTSVFEVSSLGTELKIALNKDTDTSVSSSKLSVTTKVINSSSLEGVYTYVLSLLTSSSICGGSNIVYELKYDTENNIGETLEVYRYSVSGEELEKYVYTASSNGLVKYKIQCSDLLYNTDLGTPLDKALTVTTETVISTVDTATTNLNYTPSKGEVIQLIHPNYYSDKIYSTYVNYCLTDSSTTTKIPANIDYTLTGNDNLILYYVSNGVKITETLTAGTTVNSSFDIYKISQVANTAKVKLDNNSTIIMKSMSSDETIATRKIMSTVLTDSSLKCYWIIKSSADGTNSLFDSGKDEKILGVNDYFIYVDSTQDSMTIFGSGTKLTKSSTDTGRWVCPTDSVSIASIIVNGIKSDISWQYLDFSAKNVEIFEMSITNIEENDNITVTSWNEVNNSTTSEYLANDWRECTGNITITYSGEDSIIYPKITDYYYIRSRLDIMGTKTSPQTIYKSATNNNSRTPIFYINGSAVTVDDLTEEGTYINLQTNQDEVLIGENNINLSSFATGDKEALKLYFYRSTDIEDTTKYIDDTSSSSTGYEYSFFMYNESGKSYPNAPTAYILPLYVASPKDDVYVDVWFTADDAEQGEIDIPFIEMMSGETTTGREETEGSTLGEGYKPRINSMSYLIPIYTASTTVTLHVRTHNPYEALDDIALYILEDIKLVTGVNNKLSTSLSTKIGSNPIIDRIKTIISESDTPSVVPYIVKEPDNTMALDLDLYTHYDSDSLSYDTLAFDNPDIMYDVNNIASFMTITQVDLRNSTIDIEKKMRDYK